MLLYDFLTVSYFKQTGLKLFRVRFEKKGEFIFAWSSYYNASFCSYDWQETIYYY